MLRDVSLSEQTATKRLIELRCRGDVLPARAKVAGERVDEQQSLVLSRPQNTGTRCQRNPRGASGQDPAAARELLGSQYDSGLHLDNAFLDRASRPVVEAKQFANFVNQGVRATPQEELEALRSFAPHLVWQDQGLC
jgi:hypothetical protein